MTQIYDILLNDVLYNVKKYSLLLMPTKNNGAKRTLKYVDFGST